MALYDFEMWSQKRGQKHGVGIVISVPRDMPLEQPFEPMEMIPLLGRRVSTATSINVIRSSSPTSEGLWKGEIGGESDRREHGDRSLERSETECGGRHYCQAIFRVPDDAKV